MQRALLNAYTTAYGTENITQKNVHTATIKGRFVSNDSKTQKTHDM